MFFMVKRYHHCPDNPHTAHRINGFTRRDISDTRHLYQIMNGTQTLLMSDEFVLHNQQSILLTIYGKVQWKESKNRVSPDLHGQITSKQDSYCFIICITSTCFPELILLSVSLLLLHSLLIRTTRFRFCSFETVIEMPTLTYMIL